MIPADRFRDNGDGTAWIVFSDNEHNDAAFQWDMLDRPCDTYGCDGGVLRQMGRRDGEHCPDCIDGRHTWTAEVEEWLADNIDTMPAGRWSRGGFAPSRQGDVWTSRHVRSVRLSVVPDMVLPIVNPGSCRSKVPQRSIEMWDSGECWQWFTWDQPHAFQVALPDAAKPGDWAVRVRWENVKP